MKKESKKPSKKVEEVSIESIEVVDAEEVVAQEEAIDQEEEKGLGDKVEEIIQKIAPKLAKQFENCPGCKKRKRWLNKNINGNFG